MRRSIRLIVSVFTILVAANCDGTAVAPAPAPDPTLQVRPIDSSGPLRITFISASVSPGSVIAGCGTLVEGCLDLVACLWGETLPFTVRAGVTQTIDVPIDRADRCGTPTTIATLAAVVEGPIQVASRQTWSLHYVFAP